MSVMQKHFGKETSLTRTPEGPSRWKGNIKNDKKKYVAWVGVNVNSSILTGFIIRGLEP
jgi:hypothetical protein